MATSETVDTNNSRALEAGGSNEVGKRESIDGRARRTKLPHVVTTLGAAALAACGDDGSEAADASLAVTPPAGAPPDVMPPGTMPPSVPPPPPAPSPPPPEMAPPPSAPAPSPAPSPAPGPAPNPTPNPAPSPDPAPPAPTPDPTPQPQPQPQPPPVSADPWKTLNRFAYGASPRDLERVRQMGASAWIDEQIAAPASDDAATQDRISRARLNIEYEADARWPAVNEDRALTALGKSAQQLWSILDNRDNVPWAEKVRPVAEVRVATWLRAVYSPYQLREVLTEFWHNHFHVSAEVDEEMAVLFPTYDAMLRAYAFGNFRTLLEAVARHPCMLFYLDNASNQLSPANENYARELMELHTLGAANYLAGRYANAADVPKGGDGVAIGYVDADVREAARAFTGWTVANGAWSQPDNRVLADTGEPIYQASWHDKTAKRVLGKDVPANQADLVDGRQVLDLLANHPGTARFMCEKLVRRLVADDPPAAVVDAAVAAWNARRSDAKQIGYVVRAIFEASAALDPSVRKAKRPFEFMASHVRATGAELKPDGFLFWLMESQNYKHFSWPAPTGHPDRAGAWTGASALLMRWNAALATNGSDTSFARFDPNAVVPIAGKTTRQLVDQWVARLLPTAPSAATLDNLYALLAIGKSADAVPEGDANWVLYRLRLTLTAIVMLNEFQYR